MAKDPPQSPSPPEPAAPLRLAIIGTGAISQAHLATALKNPKHFVIEAIADTNRPAAVTFAKRTGTNPEVFNDHRTLLRNAPVEAVIVATPTGSHYSIASDFLEAGAAVLLEYPAVITLNEAKELQEISDRKNTKLMVGSVRRFDRDAAWIKQWIEKDPHHFGQFRTFDLAAWANVFAMIGGSQNTGHWLIDGKKAGGGIVMSIAIHRLDLIRYLTGCDFVEVTAHGRFDPPFVNGAESSATVLLKTDKGATGVLHANFAAPRCPSSESMAMFGTYGTVIQQADQPGQYTGPMRFASARGKRTSNWQHQYEDFALVPATEVSRLEADPFVNQLLAFEHAVHKNQKPASSIEDHFNTIATIDAIYESLKTGKTVSVMKTK